MREHPYLSEGLDTDKPLILVVGTVVRDPELRAQAGPGPGEELVALPRPVFREAAARLVCS